MLLSVLFMSDIFLICDKNTHCRQINNFVSAGYYASSICKFSVYKMCGFVRIQHNE